MAILNNKILFGIVTYKEKYWETDTYLSLIDSYNKVESAEDINIFIFDNTDIEDWSLIVPAQEPQVNIQYLCLNLNLGISKAYNKIWEFADNNNFEWIVFLDQDTALPDSFYEIYSNKAKENIMNYPFAIPVIFSQNQMLSPSKYFFYRSFLHEKIQKKYLSLANVSCINSGLMISTVFFKDVHGYNEDLKLDFCDHDFIDRIKLKIDLVEILDIKLEQNFSSETNSLEKAIFRYKIFVKDLRVFSKFRNKFLLWILVDVPHLLKLTLKYKNMKFIFVRFGINI